MLRTLDTLVIMFIASIKCKCRLHQGILAWTREYLPSSCKPIISPKEGRNSDISGELQRPLVYISEEFYARYLCFNIFMK